MQIIARKESESIVIDNGIIVTVVEVGEDEVCIQIEHPEDVSIETGEACAAVC
jgi:carbon storage regulator CsrA